MTDFSFYEIESGRNWISKRWKLCKPLQTESDGTYLKYVISNIYDAVAMVNYPYENDFLKPVPGNPVSVNIHRYS